MYYRFAVLLPWEDELRSHAVQGGTMSMYLLFRYDDLTLTLSIRARKPPQSWTKPVYIACA